jgi:hypothetical protein
VISSRIRSLSIVKVNGFSRNAVAGGRALAVFTRADDG